MGELRTAAHQLPWALRSSFLQRVAAQLDGREFGDADVHRVAHGVVRAILSEPQRQHRAKPKREQEETLKGFGVSP